MERRMHSNGTWNIAVLAIAIVVSTTWGSLPCDAGQASTPSPEALAREILEATGIRGGLIVHIGCGDGKLTAALGASDRHLVHGLGGDAAEVARAREHIRSLGLYGRVSVEGWSENHLPYTDNLVNLIVSEDLRGIPMNEVLRVLCPGGVAYTKREDRWTKAVKPRPEGMDEWTHALHSPDNNAVSDDTLVGPPHHIQWVGGPTWARSHDHLASVSTVVSSGGRIFSIVDEGPTAFVVLPARWHLVARDAFNGVVLWKRPIEPWEAHLRGFRSGPPEISRRLVAAGERVYVTLAYGAPLSALDAATGETIETYEGTAGTLEIIHSDGILFLAAGDRAAGKEAAVVGSAAQKGEGKLPAEAWRLGVTPPARSKRLLAINSDTGDLLWKKSDAETAEVMPTTLAVSGGRVFYQNPDAVFCLDAESGRRVWRAERPIVRRRLGWSTPTLVVHGDVVLSADRKAPGAEEESDENGTVEWVPSSAGGNAPVGELIAFSAENGKRLWSCPCRECYNAPVDVLVAGGLVWTGDLVTAKDPGITAGRDPRTGAIKKERPRDQESFRVGMGHHRCYRNKATNRYLILGRAGVEFIDVASGKAIVDHWVRGTCQYGVMPANGLIYAPPHSCACFIEAKLNGFNALAPARRPGAGPERRRSSRLERGPAYGEPAAAGAVGATDWPTYRHDPARSGRTPSAFPGTRALSWQADLGGRLSSIVVAGGKVFVAQVDAHTVHALDARTGARVWSYTACGRVDSPPTYHRGWAIFGSADGCVYCLRASDGALVWRFRAGPEDRRIVSYGQVESTWPVHGSVLVVNDSAYFAAGRSSFLDGGMYLYRLDPRTGVVFSVTSVNSRDPETGQEPKEIIQRVNMSGALPDVLSSDGTSVYMRHNRYDLQGAAQAPDVPHLYSPAGFLDDAWWHRTYWLVGSSMRGGYGGWLVTGRSVPAGRLLVCGEPCIYGYGRSQYVHHGSHVGIDGATVFHFRPARDTGTRQTYYRLFAADARGSDPPQKKAGQPGAAKKGAGKGAPSSPRYRWSRRVPLLVRAMVLARDTLCIAGPPDVFASEDPVATLEGRRGGLLHIVSTADGESRAERRLDAPPVFDGMAVANRGLYVSSTDGKVLCFR